MGQRNKRSFRFDCVISVEIVRQHLKKNVCLFRSIVPFKVYSVVSEQLMLRKSIARNGAIVCIFIFSR